MWSVSSHNIQTSFNVIPFLLYVFIVLRSSFVVLINFEAKHLKQEQSYGICTQHRCIHLINNAFYLTKIMKLYTFLNLFECFLLVLTLTTDLVTFRQ